MVKIRKDSIPTGWIIGIATLPGFYLLIRLIGNLGAASGPFEKIFRAPNPQLILLALNMLLFRVLIVNRKEIETAKGLFMVIFLMMLLYMMNEKIHFI